MAAGETDAVLILTKTGGEDLETQQSNRLLNKTNVFIIMIIRDSLLVIKILQKGVNRLHSTPQAEVQCLGPDRSIENSKSILQTEVSKDGPTNINNWLIEVCSIYSVNQ